MSYILEALKKSEIERRAGSVCGLTPGATYVVASGAGSGRAGIAILAAVGLLGVGLALGAWHPWQAPAAAELVRGAALPSPVPSAAQAVIPPPPAVTKAAGSAKSLAAVRSGAAVAVRSVARPAPRPAAPAEAGNRAVVSGDLPAELRSRLPKITFGGYAGTDEAETRIAFINNRLVKEGEEVSPGVKLEAVDRAGVVLGFQGYHFRPGP